MQEGSLHYSICQALHTAEMSLLVNVISLSYLAFPSLFSVIDDLGG